jgi:hypothetical protein
VVVRQLENKILNFKTFESTESKYLSQDDIQEIFLDLIDDGYQFNFYSKVTTLYPTSYYFDFRKQFNEAFNFNTETLRYGCQDLDSMSNEIQKVLSILKDAKERINSMGYDIGFEPEFSFSEDTLFCITCHMSHGSIKDEDGEY